ncbi:MAG: hypothetical protein HFJ60_03975 [Clostridia bacterium]|jgi:hypothetical protein|nr:hypothetical protein [Clostridia bacterium]
MKQIIMQLKALGVIRFVLFYLLVALEFILNLPYIIIRNIYLIFNLMFKRTDKFFERERIILLLKIGFTRKFLYKCKEDYKHYIKNL